MCRRIGSVLVALIMALTVFVVIPEDANAKTTGASKEEFANVVVFVYFDDMDQEETQEKFQKSISSILTYYDGNQGQSFKNYMNTISYGQFGVHNYFPQKQENGDIAGPLKLEGITSDMARKGNVDPEILGYVAKHIPAMSGTKLDYNASGYIDNLTIVALGDMKGMNAFTGNTLAAAHSYQDTSGHQYSGKTIHNYNLLPWQQVVGDRSGVIAHEFLHTLGYADLYNSGNDYPVGCWDIMAGTSYPQWPLAYNRMHFKKWISIDTIKESKTLKLDLQSNKDGNQAFILESPLSSEEVFVVEFRKKAELYSSNVRNEDDLDIGVGGSGLIVYRVNKSVERLSNYHGSTAEYIFRPQGASGNVKDAFLSVESGRTSIGSSNMSDILEDGALTFTDGSNSGIVISQVSSSAGDSMTCKVSIPDAEQLDVWEDTNFPDIQASSQDATKLSNIVEYNDIPYVMAYNGSLLQAYSYENNSWRKAGDGISAGSNIAHFEQFSLGSDLYCAYSDINTNKLYVSTLNKSSWTSPQIISNVNNGEFDVEVQDNKAVFAYLSDVVVNFSNSSSKIKTTTYSTKGFEETETVNTQKLNEMYGQAKIQFIDGIMYVAGRCADDTIDMYKKSNNEFSIVSDGEAKGNGYEMLAFNGKIYIASGSNNAVAMHEYDPSAASSSWKHGGNNSIANYSPLMIGSNGDIYYVASSSTSEGRITVNKYIDSTHTDDTHMTFDSEGESVDGYADGLSMITMGEDMYISYTLNSSNKIKVKMKKQSNPTIPGHYYHEWGSPTVVTKATFTNEGKMISSCNMEGCNKTKTTLIPAASKVQLSKTNFTYNGARQKPGVTVKNAVGETVGYSFQATGGVAIGTYSAKVTLDDNRYQSVSKKLYYKINPKGTSIKSPKRYKKAFKARWAKQKTKITGYQIRYARKSSMSGSKYKTVKGYKKTSIKVKKLAKKKRYYVQVRTYKKSGGKTYYSNWSSRKSVVTK